MFLPCLNKVYDDDDDICYPPTAPLNINAYFSTLTLTSHLGQNCDLGEG